MYNRGSSSMTLLIVAIVAFLAGWMLGSQYDISPRPDAPARRVSR